MPRGKLKAKGAATQGTRVEEPGDPSHRFLCTKEVGTPKASFNWGINGNEHVNRNDEPSATPIKIFFSLLKAGKLKASWKKAKGKLKASERQAKNKLKGN